MSSSGIAHIGAALGGIALLRYSLGTSLIFAIALSLPPGPSPWPVVGNTFQIPMKHAWLVYSEWAKTYGDIIYLNALGQRLVVINSTNIAKDLLDKRSSIYSNRPRTTMAGELCGYGEVSGFRQHDDIWKRQRRMMSHALNQSSLSDHYAIQEIEAQRLVLNVLNNPDSLVHQTKLRIGSIILHVVYGYAAKSENDPFLVKPLKMLDNFVEATVPGAWLVDIIPPLKYIPKWVPGAGFQKIAASWRQLLWESAWEPYLWCKANYENGTDNRSFIATNLAVHESNLSSKDEETLVWGAITVMGGGLDTNMSTVLTFFLAMLRYPEIQVKACAEIDTVIGADRLPSITDRLALSYIRALITEVYRWNPAVPLGIPHSVTQDDTYEGMYIPEGSIIMPNVWHMLHDPEIYPEPMAFKPERYKDDAEMQNVTDLSFGFGRRACPGMHFAQGTIFAIIATVLATCEILPALDPQGNEIIPKVAYTSGAIIFPEEFKCRLKCRSSQARALLTQAANSTT
ncbi:cytochrome P450 [Wolfiporia cocos MD-104 SS10]|uniref:Cytochrome P450 n=1 Tax=Wolfiporia cocos (strain MD-104) TaxID=742152 RepID=A0A2H3JZ21_WOLCO|nr:cytochrome P450 [Wolfiporia cocos MD-104 SS10]